MIPGNDQNTIPTNQEATGSKLDRTSQLTFCGSRGHLKSVSGDFFGVNLFTRMYFQVFGEILIIKGTIFEYITDKHYPPFLGIPMTWNHLDGVEFFNSPADLTHFKVHFIIFSAFLSSQFEIFQETSSHLAFIWSFIMFKVKIRIRKKKFYPYHFQIIQFKIWYCLWMETM